MTESTCFCTWVSRVFLARVDTSRVDSFAFIPRFFAATFITPPMCLALSRIADESNVRLPSLSDR